MGGRGTALRLAVAALVALRWSLHFWLGPTPDVCRAPPRAEGWYAPQPSAYPNRSPLTQPAPAEPAAAVSQARWDGAGWSAGRRAVVQAGRDAGGRRGGPGASHPQHLPRAGARHHPAGRVTPRNTPGRSAGAKRGGLGRRLCPGRAAAELTARERRSCAAAALLAGIHPAAGVPVGAASALARHHGLGVLCGACGALLALRCRLDAHAAWLNHATA